MFTTNFKTTKHEVGYNSSEQRMPLRSSYWMAKDQLKSAVSNAPQLRNHVVTIVTPTVWKSELELIFFSYSLFARSPNCEYNICLMITHFSNHQQQQNRHFWNDKLPTASFPTTGFVYYHPFHLLFVVVNRIQAIDLRSSNPKFQLSVYNPITQPVELFLGH